MAKKPLIVPRKPPQDDARDRFVLGESSPERSPEPKRPNAPAPKRSVSREPKDSGYRQQYTRADGREIRKVSIYFGRETAKRLAVYCANEDRDMSTVVDEVVAEYLSKKG